MNAIPYLEEKIIDAGNMLHLIRGWRLKSDRIVFTNGCFDLLHIGHLHTLAFCADQGERVVVALNSDASVRRLKGEGRPLVPQQERALMLAAFYMVDAIVIFDEDTPLELIRALEPDVLVKGGDWAEEAMVGADLVRAAGGQVLRAPFQSGWSTTALALRLGDRPA
jgi:rfaE bifunctional protein nucleotidyltransferase chain/domain